MRERKKILVIDSGLGNINSLTNSINNLDFDYTIINKPDENIVNFTLTYQIVNFGGEDSINILLQ